MSSSEVYPGIIADPEILGGEAVIKGTRIPVALILGHLASGMSIDEIIYEYDITREDIFAALAYNTMGYRSTINREMLP
jgi:uncharacterized protein (DUF433 family)